jgi:hypothetical protein
MTVYVDELIHYTKSPLGARSWCHMATDGDVSELHAMASAIGLKRGWFQEGKDGRFPHYDLVASKRVLAVKNGAVPVSGLELARKCWIKECADLA